MRDRFQRVLRFVSERCRALETREAEDHENDAHYDAVRRRAGQMDLIVVKCKTLLAPNQYTQDEDSQKRDPFEDEHHLRGKRDVAVGDVGGSRHAGREQDQRIGMQAQLAQEFARDDRKAAERRHAGQHVAEQERPTAQHAGRGTEAANDVCVERPRRGGPTGELVDVEADQDETDHAEDEAEPGTSSGGGEDEP